MKRRWTGFLAAVVILVSSCLPALSTIAAEKEETALQKVSTLDDSKFDWSDPVDGQVLEAVMDFV